MRTITFHDGKTAEYPEETLVFCEHAHVEAGDEYLVFVFADPTVSSPNELKPFGVILPGEIARLVIGEIVAMTQRPQPPAWWVSS